MKWFTYGNFSEAIRVHGNYMRRKRGWSAPEAQQNHLALVFGHDTPGVEPSQTDLEALAKNEQIYEILGEVFFALYVPNHSGQRYLILTEYPDLIDDPDKASLDSLPVRMFVRGEERTYWPRKRFADCRTLLKALGCAKCPDNGWPCHSRALLKPGEDIAALRTYIKITPEEVQESFIHGESTVEGYTFASPVMTKPRAVAGVNFLTSLRHVREHDFTAIEEWTTERSEASKRAAVSRRFKKHQCAKCLLGTSGCRDYRYCTGRYPSKKRIIDYFMKNWQPRTHKLPKTIKPWQFWVLAHRTGATGKYDRCNVILAGLHWDLSKPYGQWRISVSRSKTSIYEKLSTDDYSKVAGIFDLPLTRKEAMDRGIPTTPPSRLAQALWFRTMELHDGRRKCFGGTNNILVRQLTKYGADLQFTNGRYVYGDTSINQFQDLFTRLEKDIGCPQLDGRRVKRGTGLKGGG